MSFLRVLLARLLLAWQRWTEAQHKDVLPAEATPAPVPVVQPEAPPVTPQLLDLDYLNILALEIHLKNQPGVTGGVIRNAAVTARIEEAQTDGHFVYTLFKGYSWPHSKDGATDAIAYFGYYLNGVAILRKFDFWRVGGQVKKTATNISEGYDGLSMPPRGTDCWTMISSLDGKQRSNVCRVAWR